MNPPGFIVSLESVTSHWPVKKKLSGGQTQFFCSTQLKNCPDLQSYMWMDAKSEES